MKFFSKLFGGEKLFQAFSVGEKRELLNLGATFLAGEKSRREGKTKVVDLSGAQPLAERLSDQELDTLIEIRKLTREADSTSGPKAISLYKRVAKLAPWDEISVMSIGVEYAQAGNFQEGIRWLEKALRLNSDNKRVKSNLDGVKKAAGRSR